MFVMAGAEEQQLKLPELFCEIVEIYDKLETNNESTNSDSVQKLVKSGLLDCEKSIYMVNVLHLFSDNEELEEVATNELKYMLLSAYLAYFTQKVTSEDRMVILRKAEQYFRDFLLLCKSYSICPRLITSDLEEENQCTRGDNHVINSGPPDLQAMKKQREEKIKRYSEKKETERKISELRKVVEKDHVDEDVKREYYVAQLKYWVYNSLDELKAIQDEIPLLEQMNSLRMEDRKEVPKPKEQPLRPFILTKSSLQKEVFGLGYPAIPTMTVEEFYEKKVADGTFHPHSESLQDWAMNPEKNAAAIEEEDIEKEEKLEKDDPVTLIRERNWDEWKDDHRRGWGNRQNMG